MQIWHIILLQLALCLLHARNSSARPLAGLYRDTRGAKDIKNSDKEEKSADSTKEEKEEKKGTNIVDIFSVATYPSYRISISFSADELRLFQGDIVLEAAELEAIITQENADVYNAFETQDLRRGKRRVGSGMESAKTRIWPNCEVPYKYHQRLRKQNRTRGCWRVSITKDSIISLHCRHCHVVAQK
jgi:hypothetical protein